jgi:hypothetical protein
MNPFLQYYQRYRDVAPDFISKISNYEFAEIIISQSSKLNNYFMAGLGMGTLFLRMGAVIQMSQKLHDGDTSNDALFMKQVMDNLRETLPSDTNWKNLWYASMQAETKWAKALTRDSGNNTILDRFVSFRNKYIHQYLRLIPEHLQEIRKGIQIMEEMASLYALFEGGEIIEKEEKYFWKQDKKPLELHPFIQKGTHEGLPYLFQGMYENKTKAKFINTLRGDETEPHANNYLEEKFQPMQNALRGGAGQIFDHSERMSYYLDCFVGRDREVEQVIQWINSGEGKKVLPIYSEAGMGKGALIAKIIDELIHSKTPVIYHFCGSGMQNNLHAVLYHFILQGKKMPGMNGAGVWKIEEEIIQRKMERLPSRYYDAIKLFQTLLETCYQPPKQSKDKPLVIVIDGLDEAAVANNQLKIADWFYIYNDKDEIEKEWNSPSYIKWIFTYRSLSDKEKQGFQLGGRFNLEELPSLQPLYGLTEEAVRAALKKFEVSEEFIQEVMKKGAVA